ncbi:hypothetical protein DOTSEDRAFT_25517 [Dothistroma septosporum NZE10]|uniref:Uncharacterized protein n=1 Tax=Dothistroma septosporum (strain NZE10 / CBS 128990) TaxID=675120 RepID=M2Y5R8_DOTSN|nr:hypothetical protein DOTSEDRAFT_25517 [Dothistroma septosporum NZE10]
MATNHKDEKDFADIELGAQEPTNTQVHHDSTGHAHAPSRRTSDSEFYNKDYTTSYEVSYTPSSRHIECHPDPPISTTYTSPAPSTNPQRPSTLSKILTRLSIYTWLLPKSAHLLTTILALPGFFSLFHAFQHKILTTGICGPSISADLSDSALLWIVYAVLWLVLMEIEVINRAFPASGKGGYKKEAMRVCAGPFAVGMWIVVAAVVEKKVESHCQE